MYQTRSPKVQHRVLVVDDNTSLRELVGQILEAAGFVVTQVGSPAEALEAIHDQEFDLLLSDIVMPGGDGVQLARTIKARKPSIRVMLMTGFHDDLLVLDQGWTLLEKPFLPKQLTATVRKTLAAPQKSPSE